MSTERVVTDNEFIAQFMGVHRKNGRVYVAGRCGFVEKYYPNQLKYNNNWDWLMPVVEKIDRLNFRTSIAWKGHASKDANIVVISERDYTMIVDVSHGSKIGAVYNAVVEFIKWYNSSPSPIKENTPEDGVRKHE